MKSYLRVSSTFRGTVFNTLLGKVGGNCNRFLPVIASCVLLLWGSVAKCDGVSSRINRPDDAELRPTRVALPGELIETRHLLLQSTLEALKRDFSDYKGAIPRLHELASSPEELSAVWRTIAAGWQREGQIGEAADAYFALIKATAVRGTLEKIEPGWSVRPDRWIRRQLNELHTAARQSTESALLTSLEARIRGMLDEALQDESIAALEAGLDYFGELSVAEEYWEHLGKQLLIQGRLLESEPIWLRLRNSHNENIQRNATAQLCLIYSQLDRSQVTAAYVQELLDRWPESPCLNGKTVNEWLDSLPPESSLSILLDESPPWPKGPVDVAVRDMPGNRGIEATVVADIGQNRSVSDSIHFDPEKQLLFGRDANGRKRWELNLVGIHDQRFGHNWDPVMRFVQTSGGLAIASLGLQRFAINTLSAEKQPSASLLWHEHFLHGSRALSANVSVSKGLRPPRAWGWRYFDIRDGLGEIAGPGLLLRESYIECRYHQLVAKDAITNEVIWQREGFPPGTRLFGDEQAVFAVPPESAVATVLDPIDGSLLGRRDVPVESERMATLGRSVLTWSPSSEGADVSLVDAWTGKQFWRLAVNRGARAVPVHEWQEVALLDAEGQFQLLSVPTGKVLVQDQLDLQRGWSEMDVIAIGPYRLAALSGRRRDSRSSRSAVGSHSVFADGAIQVFDVSKGVKCWSASAENIGIPILQPQSSPILTLATNVIEPPAEGRGQSVQSHHIRCLDLRDGTVIADVRSLPGHSRWTDIEYDVAHQLVKIFTEQKVIELHPRAPNAESPVEPPTR